MMTRSYVPTDELIAIRANDPALAEKIEKLCRAVQALRGFAMTLEAHSTLSYSAAAVAPFVTMADAFDMAMLAKADAKQASLARSNRKPFLNRV
jgi:hypothetical protein